MTDAKPFSITVIQVYAPTTDTQEAEADQFYEDLEELLELWPYHSLFLASGSRRSESLFGWSFPVAWCIRHLKGQPLWSFSVVQLSVLACGERETTVMAPPTARDSAVSPCLHGCLVFLHRNFPLRSPPSRPMGPSPRSQQQTSPWDCSPIPTFQLPAPVLSRGLASLSRVYKAAARIVCVILIPFTLSQLSCFTFSSLKCFSSVLNSCSNVRL